MRQRHHYINCPSFARIIWIAVAIGMALSAFTGRFASAGSEKTIPEDAIRIRIVANSDKEADQSVKNKVKSAVAAYIESWGAMPGTREEARELIASRMPGIQRLVDEKLDELQAPYEGVAELAEVPFPARTFQGESYAAGDYEALRIQLGQGKGANWWCVLFPPLCLTAATAKADPAEASAAEGTDADAGEPKAKFFLWEMLEKLFSFLGSLFS
ncbi:stage II sporulation protein R [Paenibacillaceae bacterium WGS1546]|uniref:stage II sporulation protein R n=1 Tax=Cohnella sp. WGS1546 TaxID=3366810 RepID=UPI00372D1060